MYMGDLLTSVSSLQEAKTLYRQAKDLFAAGGFELRKWSSNSSLLLDSLEKGDVVISRVEFDSCSVLGLRWLPDGDLFDFRVELEPRSSTKRNILSTVARIFDPLGFLSPVTLYLKGLIKQLWQEGADWDHPPSPEVTLKWKRVLAEFAQLTEVRIPRFLGIRENTRLNLYGFCDVSENGYGAVIYLKGEADKPYVSFVCGKAKVAPTKVISIPRLELCAALLLSKLFLVVVETFTKRNLKPEIFAFSDSTVVLCWLNSEPNRWNTFVANRVAKIQSNLRAEKWAHIKGAENPADCLSRGLTPQELSNHPYWFHGPDWLLKNESQWPTTPLSFKEEDCHEQKKKLALQTQVQPENIFIQFIQRFSSFQKLLNSMIYLLLFVQVLPKQILITASDCDKAELTLCKIIQSQISHPKSNA
ncbi:uncharacterized protein LOC106661013 [Cimex lectularius]|uniref:Uncharacterized protein n=1 Tax=Cimex lectularius TaxID=79782 RepID=A0A8I6R635_CIMLE|nr:uncharacterized protein LOC106661013 [Cimex lectularius]